MTKTFFKFSSYLASDNKTGAFQIASTLAICITCWSTFSLISNSQLNALAKVFVSVAPLTLLSLLMGRTFALMHECGHGALFKSRKANRSAAILLGWITLVPQISWSRNHRHHHNNTGNWDVFHGPLSYLTIDKYNSLGASKKFIYRLKRHWASFFIGSFWYFNIKFKVDSLLLLVITLLKIPEDQENLLSENNSRGRRFGKIFKSAKRIKSQYRGSRMEVADLYINNLMTLLIATFLASTVGLKAFFVAYFYTTTLYGFWLICIFFLQHNFKNSYASKACDWDPRQGIRKGTSDLSLPGWAHWISLNIGYHSAHHLCDKVPNYNLKKFSEANKDLLERVAKISLKNCGKHFNYIAWDHEKSRAVRIAAEKESPA